MRFLKPLSARYIAWIIKSHYHRVVKREQVKSFLVINSVGIARLQLLASQRAGVISEAVRARRAEMTRRRDFVFKAGVRPELIKLFFWRPPLFHIQQLSLLFALSLKSGAAAELSAPACTMVREKRVSRVVKSWKGKKRRAAQPHLIRMGRLQKLIAENFLMKGDSPRWWARAH